MCHLDEVYNNDAHIKYIAHKLLSVVLDVEIVHGWITAAMTPVVTTVKRAAWQWASIDNVARVFYNDISHTVTHKRHSYYFTRIFMPRHSPQVTGRRLDVCLAQIIKSHITHQHF